MAVNVIMIGASRSGKTSILASMLNNIRDNRGKNAVNQYFFVNDVTDYSGLDDAAVENVELQENVDRMKDLLKSSINGEYVPKMTGLYGSQNSFKYKMDVQYKTNGIASTKTQTIIFNDIPGEWCANKNYALIKDEIQKSQIILVAVDVPSLMYARQRGKASLNTVMNCPDVLFNAIQDLGIGLYDEIVDPVERNKKLNDLLRMVIFVPIKCEYWLHEGKTQEVIDEIKQVYSATIMQCKQFDNMQVMILPLETIGSCCFSHHSAEGNSFILKYANPRNAIDEYEDLIDNKGVIRCEKISESTVRLKNGSLYQLRDGDELVSAKERRQHPYCYENGTKIIPYAWFKAESNNYAPKYCELLFCRILKFTIMDLTKRTGRSAREAFDNATSWYQYILSIPNYLDMLFSGANASYADVEQVKNYRRNILTMEENGILDEQYITYLVNREDGQNIPISIEDKANSFLNRIMNS